MAKRKKYDENFKKMVVELYQSGQSVEQLGAEYGLSTQTIYRWIKLYTQNSEIGMTEAEMLVMKKEMARMQEEITILKKALTIFAQK
ncbi:MAG: transposase [Enterococcus lemanii]|jgi:transposase